MPLPLKMFQMRSRLKPLRNCYHSPVPHVHSIRLGVKPALGSSSSPVSLKTMNTTTRWGEPVRAMMWDQRCDLPTACLILTRLQIFIEEIILA